MTSAPIGTAGPDAGADARPIVGADARPTAGADAGPCGDALADALAEQQTVALRAVRSVLGVTADEEDLVQEAMARLVTRLRQPGELVVSAWTWRVAHNLAVDHVRARRAVPTDGAFLDREVGDGLDEAVIASGLASAVRDGLARLPDRQREALMAQAALDGGRGGHALVAAKLGVSPKAAESILARARHALRRELGQWVAVGAFVGWVARRLRRLLTPRSALARVALVAALGAGAAAASMPLWDLASAPPPGPRRPSPAVTSPVRTPPPSATAVPSLPSLPPLVTLPTVPRVQVPVTLPPTLPHVTVPSVSVPRVTVPQLP